jgi:hypothetical protein
MSCDTHEKRRTGDDASAAARLWDVARALLVACFGVSAQLDFQGRRLKFSLACGAQPEIA